MSKIHGTILSVRKFNGWFYLKIKEPVFNQYFQLSVNEVLICQVLSAANLITSEVPSSDQMLKLTERFILEFFVSHEAP